MKYIALLASLVVVLTACGQPGAESPLAPSLPEPTAVLAPVTVKVRWPQQTGQLAAQAISDNAESIVVSVAAAGAPATTIDTLTLNNIATVTEGIIEAPIGSDVFTATAYSGADGAGDALGTVQLTQTIVEGQVNSVSLALTGIADTVEVTIADEQLLSTAETTSATAVVKDASGFVLVGRTVTWSSDDTGVATVNGSGAIAAVGAGTATITATDNINTDVNGNDTLTVTETDITVSSH